MTKRSFVIKGPNFLQGSIEVLGSKNAALPILAATILTRKRCVISNIPLVSDVYLMLSALKDMGSEISWLEARTVTINNKTLSSVSLNENIVKRMRASILLLGPMLARFGKVEKMRYPGGCTIGPRPIDVHLKAFEDLGAVVDRQKDFFSVKIDKKKIAKKNLVFSEFSVSATENILMFLAAIESNTSISIAACEPHIRDLARALKKMGANIRGAGTPWVRVSGTTELTGIEHKIIPDYIEGGTFVLGALAVGGNVEIRNIPIIDLELAIKRLIDFGADILIDKKRDRIRVMSKGGGINLKGHKIFFDRIQTMPHPGVPTDLQSAFGVFATQSFGESFIHEPLYENRLEWLDNLIKMGAKIKILDPHRAIISGPIKLHGAKVYGRDLRSTTALVLAGLTASGRTEVSGAEHVARGHEDLAGRLSQIGADIKDLKS
jgi:UDP-N-acetylglucosamine 1-carboxyvinyltransferase